MTVVAVAMSLFHLYTAYAIVPPRALRPMHVAFVLFLSFLLFPVARRFRHRVMWWDWRLPSRASPWRPTSLPAATTSSTATSCRTTGTSSFGVALVLLVLEAMRRTTGWIMPFVTACFLLYALFGA